jgi:FAD/FMN-containing dehydrogenase
VKNASGYAVERLFVGAFASLGVIAEVSLRTHPMPEASRTMGLAVETAEALEGLVARLLRSAAPIEYARARPAEGEWRMQVGVCGWEAEVEAAAEMILHAAREAGARTAEVGTGHAEANGRWRCYEPLAAAREACRDARQVWEYWPMAGLVMVAHAEGGGLAASAADLYVDEGPEGGVARRLKQLFDPKRILPPWR